jgi:hypothetical protein
VKTLTTEDGFYPRRHFEGRYDIAASVRDIQCLRGAATGTTIDCVGNIIRFNGPTAVWWPAIGRGKRSVE